MIRRLAPLVALTLPLLLACDLGGSDNASPRRTPLSSPTGENSRVISLVGTLSGPDAWRGEDALEGADAAVGRLNIGLAEGDRPYELITLDDEGNAAKATELVKEAAALEQTVGVLFAGPPQGLPPAEEALAEAGIPALLLYGDLYAAEELTPHIFQVSPSYLWQARRIVSYLLNDRRYETVGVVAEESFSGDVAVGAIGDALALFGNTRPVVVTYDAGLEDFTEPLGQLQAAGVEAVVVHANPRSFERVLASLEDDGATYAGTSSARTDSLSKKERKRIRKKGLDRPWRPQVAAFDLAMSPSIETTISRGTVAADSYARGVHYLPVPSLENFREVFVDWWDAEPLGWELRAFMAVRTIGWAVDAGGSQDDLAQRLEDLKGRRFGGLDITLGPDDHTYVGQSTVGLWTVPRSGVAIENQDELPNSLPWVPLSRGFSIDGENTDILSEDWRYLFTKAPPRDAPPPRISALRYGVSTSRSDPIH